MMADILAAIAQIAIAIGGLVAGFLAIRTYKRAKDLEAARWQKQIFDDLFLSGKFDRVREGLEIDYQNVLARVIELSIQDRYSQLNGDDRSLLLELDNFLNLIEYVLYLEQDKKQIEASDRDALLGYWLKTIGDPARSALRYYASHFGYERVAKLVGATESSFLVLYGSLRRGQPEFERLGLDKALEFVGPVQFSGELYDLGEYPGAVMGKGAILAEAYRVTDPETFDLLDEYEEFDVSDPNNSLFVRRCIHIRGIGDAWVYLYNGGSRERRIASGDWLDKQSSV